MGHHYLSNVLCFTLLLLVFQIGEGNSVERQKRAVSTTGIPTRPKTTVPVLRTTTVFVYRPPPSTTVRARLPQGTPPSDDRTTTRPDYAGAKPKTSPTKNPDSTISTSTTASSTTTSSNEDRAGPGVNPSTPRFDGAFDAAIATAYQLNICVLSLIAVHVIKQFIVS